jgi:microcystin-dependent protein
MKRLKLLALGATAALGLNAAISAPVLAQAAEPFVGQLVLFPMNWCPRNWAKANGAILPIAQHQALYSLYGTTYGGDGRQTFGLPNLEGRAPVSYSSNMPLGMMTGSSTATLTVNQMPAHNHMILAASTGPTSNNPAGGSLATFPDGSPIYASSAEVPSVAMHPNVVTPTGNNQPFSTQSPILAMNWCVSLQGIYPSRS